MENCGLDGSPAKTPKTAWAFSTCSSSSPKNLSALEHTTRLVDLAAFLLEFASFDPNSWFGSNGNPTPVNSTGTVNFVITDLEFNVGLPRLVIRVPRHSVMRVRGYGEWSPRPTWGGSHTGPSRAALTKLARSRQGKIRQSSFRASDANWGRITRSYWLALKAREGDCQADVTRTMEEPMRAWMISLLSSICSFVAITRTFTWCGTRRSEVTGAGSTHSSACYVLGFPKFEPESQICAP
ncbi:hypothetical protein EDB83DRAFT_1329167 [Lactarius deliciosus]|nr:hypothetical protein EDB83DRAFT_1329167 [Lactarius deliciosus]